MTAIRSPSADSAMPSEDALKPPGQAARTPAGQGARNQPLSRSASIAAWTSAWCCTPAVPPTCSSKEPSTRHGMLSRDHHGPRAVLNALDRLADSYAGQIDTTRQDLAIAEGQLRDHQARLGQPFAHDAYLAELTDLRDQLKAGLSQATPEPGTHARCRTGRADQVPESRPHHRRRARADGTPAASPPRSR